MDDYAEEVKQATLKQLATKFNTDDHERIIRACLLFVNTNSGNNFAGLTPEAKWMQTFINDFMTFIFKK
jgi:hypothetical protein